MHASLRSRRFPASAALVAALRVAAMLALAAGAPAAAHHSYAAFDMERERTLDGEVVRFDWTEPHTRTRLRVEGEDGSTTLWELEGMAPSYLGRRGWTSDTLEPGDRVRVTIAPLRSGEPGGTFLRVELEDGTRKVMFGGR